MGVEWNSELPDGRKVDDKNPNFGGWGYGRKGRADASNLQMAGLISYRRGRISILDRRGLQRRSCECYRFISGQYEQLQLELRRVLFHK